MRWLFNVAVPTFAAVALLCAVPQGTRAGDSGGDGVRVPPSIEPQYEEATILHTRPHCPYLMEGIDAPTGDTAVVITVQDDPEPLPIPPTGLRATPAHTTTISEPDLGDANPGIVALQVDHARVIVPAVVEQNGEGRHDQFMVIAVRNTNFAGSVTLLLTDKEGNRGFCTVPIPASTKNELVPEGTGPGK
jgi:hypothetical protein